jgi:CheY-like chemotaxis protein
MVKQILVVDETSVLVSVMNFVLSGSMAHPPRVDLARSLSAALSLMNSTTYDLLLLNSQADDLDAIGVLSHLRAADHKAEAVVVAGWLTPQLLESGRRLGVKCFFRLPAEIDELANHLRIA